MRVLLFCITSLFLLAGCNNKKNNNQNNTQISANLIQNPVSANDKATTKNLPVIHFDKTEHDFGLIIQGEMVSYTFKFKNIGKTDLIVNNVTSSCGCTVPKFSDKPIPPGGDGQIEVIFNSANRTGHQIKNISVWSNCIPNKTDLRISTEIVIIKK